MRRSAPKLLAVALATILILPFLWGKAGAHSEVVRIDPAPGSVLQSSPQEIVLEFGEKPDLAFSLFKVLNSRGETVIEGRGKGDPANDKIVRLGLPPLEQGSYLVVWRTRSAEDGHQAEGSLPFGVRVPLADVLGLQAAGPQTGAGGTDSIPGIFLRWLILVQVALLVGLSAFELVVWYPFIRAATKDRTPIDLRGIQEPFRRSTRVVVLAATVLFVLGSIFFLIAEAADAAQVSWGQALGWPAGQLLSGRWGVIWIVRTLLGGLLGALALGWRPEITRWPLRPAVLLGLGLLLTLTFSLTSHAEATGTVALFTVMADWAHLSCMTAWLGGLVPLLFAVLILGQLGDRGAQLSDLIPRFSALAANCVIVIAGTGIGMAVVQTAGVRSLPESAYGRILLIKIALLIVLLLVAAVNLLVLSPRLRRAGNTLARWFGLTIRGEIVLGASVLVTVALLTTSSPTGQAWTSNQRLDLLQQASVGGVNLVLSTSPGVVGDNVITVDVTAEPSEKTDKDAVALQLVPPGAGIPPLEIDTETENGSRFVARGALLTVQGKWRVVVTVQRPGLAEIRHSFDLQVAGTNQGAGHAH